jgi:hypothetical protein
MKNCSQDHRRRLQQRWTRELTVDILLLTLIWA